MHASVQAASYVLCHTPSMVQYGSKPRREIQKDKALLAQIKGHLRSFQECIAYPPNQVYVGKMRPDDLTGLSRPWWLHKLTYDENGGFGKVYPEGQFLIWMKLCDEFNLLLLTESFVAKNLSEWQNDSLVVPDDIGKVGIGYPDSVVASKIESGEGIPVYSRDQIIGCMLRGHEEDRELTAEILLENLACKASGVLAMRHLFHDNQVDPDSVDYVLNTGEEAVGDRYQRGAGNLAKAMAERSWCQRATGSDLKAFCCAPVHALVVASGLVSSGVFSRVLVVGGGSLAKLGMKFKGHLANDMPILEDILASFAVLVGKNDGTNPVIRLDVVGKHDVQCGSSPQAIYEALVIEPLKKAGLKITDVDKYALEMHNPEVTEPSGSGNVPRTNYRIIGSLAAMKGEILQKDIGDFERTHGMPGFSPTQGHIAAAVPFLGHAREMILNGEIRRAMFVAKGSLFLGKMTNLSDGMSFLLE